MPVIQKRTEGAEIAGLTTAGILNGRQGAYNQRLFIMLTTHGDIAFITANHHLFAFCIRFTSLIQAQHHTRFTAAETDGFQFNQFI